LFHECNSLPAKYLTKTNKLIDRLTAQPTAAVAQAVINNNAGQTKKRALKFQKMRFGMQ
jgi:hypothetical protein